MKYFNTFIACCFLHISFAQPTISFKPLVENLSRPVDIVNANDGSGRLFIVEETGRIKIWEKNNLLSNPFLDLTDTINYGHGHSLLSIAFHPDYKNNRYFFVYYVSNKNEITIARYRTSANNPNNALQNSGVILLTVKSDTVQHHGGHLQFGKDGYLYAAFGDSGDGSISQVGSSLHGKFIRIDVNNFNTPPYYTIPPNNPYLNSKRIKPEIIGFGLRNPFHWSFDRLTGDVWIADVGESSWEEVDFRSYNNRLKNNFGWNCYEGTHPYAGCAVNRDNVFPIFEYPHNDTTGGFCVIGGYVYRGAEFADLYGYYICSDYISNNGWLIKPNSSGGFRVIRQENFPSQIVSYGEAENGSLYALSLSGILYKVIANTIMENKIIPLTMKDDKEIKLGQNVPNPFNSSCIISYFIPTDFKNAELQITNSSGKILKIYNITKSGFDKKIIDGNELTNGMYQYSLIIDGKLIDTKKMMFVK